MKGFLIMKKNKYIYEIFLNDSFISKDLWLLYLENISHFIGFFKKWEFVIILEKNVVRYFIKSSIKLPLSLGIEGFLLKETGDFGEISKKTSGFYCNSISDNLIDIYNQFQKKQKLLKQVSIKFRYFGKWKSIHSKLIYEKNAILKAKKMFMCIPQVILSIDFKSNKSFFYKKIPKYLNIEKIVHLLTNHKDNALFQVDTFPYLENNFYLSHSDYDFDKHSLVIGASGSGKSKFLSLLISNIYKHNQNKYKIVVIDPHDALKEELAGIYSSRVIDFKNEQTSIDLFQNNLSDINAFVELTLSLFKDLMNDYYNSKLERVLRFSTYLLILKQDFSFVSLRSLLLDLEYRNSCINDLKMVLPSNISYFFLTEFNELKTKSYNEAIAPIIAFIDEIQMVPVFNGKFTLSSLKEVIENNFLSLFSLNRLSLGDKVTKTIAGFLMQQIFLLAQEQVLDKHLIVIIDEVAILENPILTRFLSELRKYNTSVILAGQYFHQISDELRESILANTSNYYLFRTSKTDAEILEKNLTIKLVNDDTIQNRCNLLTGLKNRECLVRISSNGTLYPVFKAITRNFYPEVKVEKN